MTDFPHDKFGVSLAENYSSDVSLALLVTEYSSKWKRQRRTYAHNASAVRVSFRLTIKTSGELVRWLQENDDWFYMDLISGNDTNEIFDVYPVLVRRISTIACSRVPLMDMNIVSFELETNSMNNYQTLLASVRGEPAFNYPADLPLPLADGFVSDHMDRNVTGYNLSYSLNTEQLKAWQAFAGFAGTAWFHHPMVSANTPCGTEVLRYVASPQLNLVSPNRWTVTVTAEGYPNGGFLAEFASSEITECSYDYPIDYNDATESYDCSGGSVNPPPQGSFVVPDGPVVVNAVATGIAPQTATAYLTLKRDGSVVSTPVGVPSWVQWHTNANTLINPSVTINSDVEVSTDGLAWAKNVPGTKYSLKATDVYMRYVYTASVSGSSSNATGLMFDDGTITYAVASVSVQLGGTVSITYPGSGFVQNFVWSDSVSGFQPSDEPNTVVLNPGVQIKPDGSCIAFSDGEPTGNWYSPLIPNIGAGLWVRVVKTSGNKTINNEGIRMLMTGSVTFSIIVRTNNVAGAVGTYVGQVNIYADQTGGTPLATGTLSLTGEITTDA